MNAYRNFNAGKWQHEIDVRDFIQNNYKPYLGDGAFLEGVTPRTKVLLDKVNALLKKEAEVGVLNVETEVVSRIDAYDAAYIDKDNEVIVGLQTDEPLKRAFHPFGGI